MDVWKTGNEDWALAYVNIRSWEGEEEPSEESEEDQLGL